MRYPATPVSDVLRRIHGIDAQPGFCEQTLGRDEIQYLCDVGLGPIAYSLYESEMLSVTPECQDLLTGADLTNQLIYQKMANTTAELIDEFRSSGIVPTLIKGISTSDQYYDPPHHRVMGDVDILVDEAELKTASSVMTRLGYEVQDTNASIIGQTHHHLPAVRHPDSGVVVELHTSLFPARSLASAQPLFQTGILRDQLRESKFMDRLVYRFTPEYQFAYTVGHWARDRKWPVNVISVNDVLHIVRKNTHFDWKLIDSWIRENDWLAGSLIVMLHYLVDCKLIRCRPELSEYLPYYVKKIGRMNLSCLEWLVHTFPVSGRQNVAGILTPWGARLIWRTMLEPRARYARFPYAIYKFMFNKRNRTKISLIVYLRKMKNLAQSRIQIK